MERISLTAFIHFSHMLTLLSANIQQFLSFSVMLKKKKKKRKTMPPCTFVLLLAKWNTYIRHHCGLHKCLKVINISSSVRLMCLVIGYLCCGLPPSKPPVALVCVCVNIYIVAGCVQSRIQYVCVCMCVYACKPTFFVPTCVCLYMFVCVSSLPVVFLEGRQ